MPPHCLLKTLSLACASIYVIVMCCVVDLLELISHKGAGGAPDKSDPKTSKVSDNRAYTGIIAGYTGVYCHIRIRIVLLGGG